MKQKIHQHGFLTFSTQSTFQFTANPAMASVLANPQIIVNECLVGCMFDCYFTAVVDAIVVNALLPAFATKRLRSVFCGGGEREEGTIMNNTFSTKKNPSISRHNAVFSYDKCVDSLIYSSTQLDTERHKRQRSDTKCEYRDTEIVSSSQNLVSGFRPTHNWPENPQNPQVIYNRKGNFKTLLQRSS